MSWLYPAPAHSWVLQHWSTPLRVGTYPRSADRHDRVSRVHRCRHRAATKDGVQIAEQFADATSTTRCLWVAREHVDDCGCRATSRLLDVLGTNVRVVVSDEFGRSRGVRRCPEDVLDLVGVSEWMQVGSGCRTHRRSRRIARGGAASARATLTEPVKLEHGRERGDLSADRGADVIAQPLGSLTFTAYTAAVTTLGATLVCRRDVTGRDCRHSREQAPNNDPTIADRVRAPETLWAWVYTIRTATTPSTDPPSPSRLRGPRSPIAARAAGTPFSTRSHDSRSALAGPSSHAATSSPRSRPPASASSGRPSTGASAG
jgi:hypothetical protein